MLVGGLAMKRVLLISFQYPPMAGSSGIQRALRFSQYLPQYGWEPMVLTANPRAYEQVSDDQMGDVPSDVHVSRTLAWDARRHLSIFGKYPACLAMPDRWMSWGLSAVPEGLRLIRKYRPAAIWSTFPLPTAHRIGLELQLKTGLPWIADFRDVMTEDGYPADPRTATAWRKLESQTIEHCTRAVFTTPGAVQMYAQRYSGKSADSFCLIENGYDEEVFAEVERTIGADRGTSAPRPLRIVHSGVIYPMERDPSALFEALGEMRRRGQIDGNTLRLVLRATGHDGYLAKLLEKNGIGDIVELAPAIPYRDALAEMLQADALLLLQGNSCNRQIPAKLYEYARVGRPILGLVSGDTADALRGLGIDTLSTLEDSAAIARLLEGFIASVRTGTAPIPTPDGVQRHSRLFKTQELAAMLNQISSATNGGAHSSDPLVAHQS